MNIHNLYRFIFRMSGFRKRRMQKFAEIMRPSDSNRILDVGGTLGTWELIATKPQVTLLNLDVSHDRNDYPENIKFEAGNALGMSYLDDSYDIVFSNSVIEHVSTWENQRQFAAEVRRVGRRLWVQTPAFEFFVEPHFLTPFIHWFSRNWRRRLLRNFTVWGWITRPAPSTVDEMVREIRLLSFQEMRTLFPDCEIYVERWLGMPKSYTAVRAAPSAVRQVAASSAEVQLK